MIFDNKGFPRDNGASDWQDSARLAGIMTLFGWPRHVPLEPYLDLMERRYVRHPKERLYDMSRDQAVCLVAGYWKQGEYELVDRSLVDGKDIFSPSVRGHFRRCQGRSASALQNLWLRLDIMYSAYIKPMDEPNQLICILMVAGPEYVRLWRKHNKKWKEAIRLYWCGWRGESELAELMISKIEGA